MSEEDVYVTDEELEQFRYLNNGQERDHDELELIRKIKTRQKKNFLEGEKRIAEENRVAEFVGQEFEDYFENNLKNATEEYSSNMVSYKDRVEKYLAWQIWMEAFKCFERKYGIGEKND